MDIIEPNAWNCSHFDTKDLLIQLESFRSNQEEHVLFLQNGIKRILEIICLAWLNWRIDELNFMALNHFFLAGSYTSMLLTYQNRRKRFSMLNWNILDSSCYLPSDDRYYEMLTVILFTNPSARAGYDTRSIFKRSLTGFEFRVFLLLD